MNAAAGNEQSSWKEDWRVLQHALRPGRYIDPEFLKLEFEKLWSKVWQVAARLDEIPEPGDYTVYEIGDQSVLVLRTEDGSIKTYHNACPHRGTNLADAAGSFPSGKIICPFHGWKWDLQGCNHFIMEQQEFKGGSMQNADVPLIEVRSEIYAGFIFVNFDDNPQPFDEFIAPIRQYLDNLLVGEMHHFWWKSVEAPCNWKVAQEAFFETFHVPATHPQLDDVGQAVVYEDREKGVLNHQAVKYDRFEKGHGRFYAGAKPLTGDTVESKHSDPVEDMIEGMAHLVHEMDAMVYPEDLAIAESLRGEDIPKGQHGAEFIKRLYARAAEEKRPMPEPKPETAAMWGGELFIFPNFLLLPNLGNVMMYRSRPHASDPNRCTFEIFSTRTYPADKPVPRAVVKKMTDPSDPEQFLLIPRQDFSNIGRIQKGLHCSGLKQVWLAEQHEKIIMNMHRELDRYLGVPEAES